MRWTLFCRVVDNYGDIGFSWRLAADLAARGERVCLAVDDASALAWLAQAGDAGVDVTEWAASDGRDADVLVETFGSGMPHAAIEALAGRHELPLRINVEHLSAEGYAARSHGLPSPRFLADGRASPVWYFYPGFGDAAGGLLREPGLLAMHAAIDRRAWLARQGLVLDEGERCVSLFGYAQPALDALLAALHPTPTLLLLAPGPLASQAAERPLGRIRTVALPFLPQPEFDALLASSDLACVRGEDSPVRALWAGVPFLWQLYPQADGAHAAKLDAFLDVYLEGADESLAAALRGAFGRWNGLGDAPLAAPDDAWLAHARSRRDALAAWPDLTTRLLEFAAARS